ncbi:NRAMP family divalent metal transporter [Halalkalicoccus jeotgali]|uniref:Mn2+ and Fe2+ transporter of the NRAMP family-like protein n=1 Tax=Halalkalicoccus jeotgali (strain DSM 18796 / CECT 7217 / JCM 14584 / KCTC 4019 / B3) TaxID=795797 RepID=D8J5B5_HALJB|nr:divalent metal cation transporter [Halalkalicoccus jeotgali]ADJ13696.1 Mn2+ and Fe2+ transporter of the NRAMP family- like protein [Halalkalicoccus jeotgali B3]ELY34257.1 Mn2+ and Fe2+ transporter-like protein [Halalkalicoccus jeotgali B3]
MSTRHYVEQSVTGTKRFVNRYGLGLLFAANVFGAGSVFILSQAGSDFGFALLWVLPLALLAGLAMHEMSARLAAADRPLMVYIRERIGETAAKPLAVGIAFIMQFWSVANYALAGAAFVYLTPLSNLYIGTILMAALGIALVELRLYNRIEGVVAALVLAIFGSYLVIVLGLDLPLGEVATGFVPSFVSEFGYLTMVIALLGTTVYYPNFFIQTSMSGTKDWDVVWKYRRDHTFGMLAVVALSVAVMAVAAMTIPDGRLTLTAPGEPLAAAIGPWALDVFVIAAGGASFTSATGTLFGAGFMVPQAFGHRPFFGERPFRLVVHALICLSVLLALPLLAFTGFRPVTLAITMPAVNGVIGLPITAIALYAAVTRYFDPSRVERALFLAVVGVLFVGSALTARDLAGTIVGYL